MHAPRPWPADGTAPGFREQKVTLIAEDPAGGLVWASGVGDKRRLLADTRGPLYACWKGRYQTHLFVVDRQLVAGDVGEGKDVKREIANADRLLIEWFQRQAFRAGLRTVGKSLAADNVTAAHRVNAAAPRPEVKAVVWFALTDLRWKGRVRDVETLWAKWDLIHGDWERADSPEWEDE